jgi:hypothetical protein
VPWFWFEIAERLVLHLIEFGKEFRNQPVRASVIGEQVVANAMSTGTPKNLNPAFAQKIAGALNMCPVAQLECRVMMLVRARLHQVDRVVIRSAAKEREEISLQSDTRKPRTSQ